LRSVARSIESIGKRLGLDPTSTPVTYCARGWSSWEIPAKGHRIYPYLLRGVSIERPNQVWCADITYIPLANGFLYLVAIMDWWSRKVLA
tara:strand:- start:8966 stop:9235 length:270 start_codon:yes stop_codon:yes gene_type:complete